MRDGTSFRQVVGGARPLWWIVGHLGLYLVLLLGSLVVQQLTSATEFGVVDRIQRAIFVVMLFGWVAIPVTAAALGVLRACLDLPALRFRLIAVAILVLPALLTIPTEVTWAFPVAHLAFALLIVQPDPG